ncbi:MAG: hypothetical protein EOP06_02420 [Proteobacteria bacterium]|nr:MAG: hypothetical protein EOP06_02420 [Pseudomonadota bacterium]
MAPPKKAKTVKKASAMEQDTKVNVTESELHKKFGIQMEGIADSEYLELKDKLLHALFTTIAQTPAGIMRGKVVEISGKSDVGKTMFATSLLLAIAEVSPTRKTFFSDAERAQTKERLIEMKYDPTKTIYQKPPFGEAALDGIAYLFTVKHAIAGILDSSTSCLPEKESQGGGGAMAAQAKMMTDKMKIIDKAVADVGGILFIISQVKTKPGFTMGNPDYISSGGSAVGFHSRLRLALSRVDIRKDKETQQQLGYTLRVKVIKNHCGYHVTSSFDIIVNNEFQILYPETVVAWAGDYDLVDKTAKTIAGIEYKGHGYEKDLIAAITGKELDVFAAVNVAIQARRKGPIIDIDKQEDTEKDNFGIEEEWGDADSATA